MQRLRNVTASWIRPKHQAGHTRAVAEQRRRARVPPPGAGGDREENLLDGSHLRRLRFCARNIGFRDRLRPVSERIATRPGLSFRCVGDFSLMRCRYGGYRACILSATRPEALLKCARRRCGSVAWSRGCVCAPQSLPIHTRDHQLKNRELPLASLSRSRNR
jgi:hypothetical protein